MLEFRNVKRKEKKALRRLVALVGGLALVAVLLVSGFSFEPIRNLASVFFIDSVSQEELRGRYLLARPIRVLIVPGHDSASGGAEYNGVLEADLTLEMGKKLYGILSSDRRFAVTLARNGAGYHPDIQAYFDEQRSAILTYRAVKQSVMQRLVDAGLIRRYVGVSHNTAPTEVALKLYGINKWANETKQDIILHIHFNDYPGRPWGKPGVHSGFAVYVPESQYSNARASQTLGESIVQSLESKYTASTLPLERAALIEDQELIAIGSNNSVDGVSMLIEYGYIYEKRFQDIRERDAVFGNLAQLTREGVEDFLDPKK